MKRIIPLMILCAAILVSCQQKAKVAPVDVNAEKAAVMAVIDKQYAALAARDANAELSFLTDDALTLGTDPNEFWTKAQQVDMTGKMLADTSLKFDFKPDKRTVVISPDGNSAIYVDQATVGFISPIVQTRRVSHLIKVNGNWMINFDSVSMIPKNEDLPVINKALEGSK